MQVLILKGISDSTHGESSVGVTPLSRVFAYEWQAKDLRDREFVRVASKGLREWHFCASAQDGMRIGALEMQGVGGPNVCAEAASRAALRKWRSVSTITTYFSQRADRRKLYERTKKSPCTPRVDREAEGRLTAMGSSCSVIQLFSKDQYLVPVVVLSFA